MKLEDIGFYTLSDKRALNSTANSRLERCELLLTKRCNFHCPYCRRVGPKDATLSEAKQVVSFWGSCWCRNMRFSGGEPTLWPGLVELVRFARTRNGVEHIAISTNGSAPIRLYEELLDAGVNDFSISLDACCAATAGEMMGGHGGMVDHVMGVIHHLAVKTYVTIGAVLLPTNTKNLSELIQFGVDAGVADIRVITAAQWNEDINLMAACNFAALEKFPILRYRVDNIRCGRSMRGIRGTDAKQCNLALDDMAVSGGYHFPCIIYLREGGEPVGKVGDGLDVREERARWVQRHDSFQDPICRSNCLDVCVDYNNTAFTRNIV
jgi:MoaA/NifB/PqqE/SkfB family radical SAM enzyme